jgi:L-lactate dehydrogenase complex protein LldG
MKALFHIFSTRERYERAQKAARLAARPVARGKGTISRAPGPLAGWTMSRELPAPAPETFREWWRRTHGPSPRRPPVRPGTMSDLTAHYAAKSDTVSTSTPHYGAEGDTVAGRGAAGSGGGHAAGGAAGASREGGGARADILHRIRDALQGAAPSDVPRNYRTEDTRERDEIVTLFAERVAEYRATVHRVREEEIAETVERIAKEAGAERIGIPPDLQKEWRPGDCQLIEDDSLSVPQLDALDGALTGCAVAIAEVGAFVLDGGSDQGRRALSLVPDVHICVVREDQVMGLVPEAVAALEGSVRAGRPLTFVAGPSATSDIELDRVEGVHGPRVLHVVVATR